MPVEAAASAAPVAAGADAEAEDAAVDVPPSEPPQAAARVRVPRARGTAAHSRPRRWRVLRSRTCPVVTLSCVYMVPPPASRLRSPGHQGGAATRVQDRPQSRAR